MNAKMVWEIKMKTLRRIKICLEYFGMPDFTGGRIGLRLAWELATIETE